ncbi:hypothetical protein ACFYXH_39740 [Streptomyces sp. NPDC002730]|uniref:hypothetical protein n=1 Tax=Streptomyces sp. NPDC002730 TaxID=3364662 RepID=UPI0036C5DAF0
MFHGVPLSFAFDDMSHLHGLAERIHNAADDLPLTNSRYARSDNLDELDERVVDITGLFVHLATAAAFADRMARRNRGQETDVTRRKFTGLTHAAGTLGRALADLGEAVAQAGLLRQLSGLPGSPERADAARAARTTVDVRIDSARRHLNEAGRQLHHDADQLTRRTPQAATARVTPLPAVPSPTTRTR